MKKMMILAALMLAVGTNAYAQRRSSGGGGGVFLGLGVMYSDSKTTSELAGVAQADSKTTTTVLDADLGYVFSSGLYLGAAYISESHDSGGVKPKGSAMGVGLGYVRGGFIGKLNYYASGSYEDGGNNKASEGTGLGADIGYLFPVSSSFNVGASIAYRNLKYKKIEVSGVETANSSLETTDTSPRLLFAFTF